MEIKGTDMADAAMNFLLFMTIEFPGKLRIYRVRVKLDQIAGA